MLVMLGLGRPIAIMAKTGAADACDAQIGWPITKARVGWSATGADDARVGWHVAKALQRTSATDALDCPISIPAADACDARLG